MKNEVEALVDEMMADALSLKGEERTAVISYIEGQRAAARSEE